MKYKMRISKPIRYLNGESLLAVLGIPPKKEFIEQEILEEFEITIKSITIDDIKSFFKKEFVFSIEGYDYENISIIGHCKLGSENPDEDIDIIEISLKENEYKNWKSINRERKINKIIE